MVTVARMIGITDNYQQFPHSSNKPAFNSANFVRAHKLARDNKQMFTRDHIS